MREVLRLSPSAPLRSIAPLEDTTLKGGKYSVTKDYSIIVNVANTHRDPAVYGDDVGFRYFRTRRTER